MTHYLLVFDDATYYQNVECGLHWLFVFINGMRGTRNMSRTNHNLMLLLFITIIPLLFTKKHPIIITSHPFYYSGNLHRFTYSPTHTHSNAQAQAYHSWYLLQACFVPFSMFLILYLQHSPRRHLFID